MELLSAPGRIILILMLLGAASTLPIAARRILKNRWEAPVDRGMKWIDGRPLFGPHKTWRGLLFSLAGTTILASFTPAGVLNGFCVAILSMTGDLLASFVKRRMNLKSGAKAVGLDQGIEALMPLLLLRKRLFISWQEMAIITILFAVSELIISPVLYRMGIRRNPY
jgi:CDP-2,3-bis-(O-geranylgeranyl)-sn-glycerol synthase